MGQVGSNSWIQTAWASSEDLIAPHGIHSRYCCFTSGHLLLTNTFSGPDDSKGKLASVAALHCA